MRQVVKGHAQDTRAPNGSDSEKKHPLTVRWIAAYLGCKSLGRREDPRWGSPWVGGGGEMVSAVFACPVEQNIPGTSAQLMASPRLWIKQRRANGSGQHANISLLSVKLLVCAPQQQVVCPIIPRAAQDRVCAWVRRVTAPVWVCADWVVYSCVCVCGW